MTPALHSLRREYLWELAHGSNYVGGMLPRHHLHEVHHLSWKKVACNETGIDTLTYGIHGVSVMPAMQFKVIRCLGYCLRE